MSIPSITLRLDFGEGSSSSVASGISLQGEAPTPMGFGSSLAGVTQTSLPTPIAGISASAAQDAAPTPMAGIGAVNAAMETPPVPSLDLGSTQVSGMTGDIPRPEGEPEAVKKPAGKG